MAAKKPAPTKQPAAPARKPAVPAKKAAAKPASAKKAAAKPAPTKKAAAPANQKAAPATPAKAAAAPAEPPAKKPRAPARPKGSPPIVKTRVVIAMDFYEPNKDAIKAPFKSHGMKWNFLGEGKGLYKREKDIHCFTQFLDDGVHYSIWGDDKTGVAEILAEWERILGPARWTAATTKGEEAAQAEVAQKESDELRLWKLAEPQARPGEPDFFLQKRRAEWLAKKPGA